MKKYVLAFIIIVLYFGGLNSVRELTDLAIVKAVSIDKIDEDKYEVCAIIIDTTDKENIDKGIVISSVGNSVHEAARNMVKKLTKKLYIAHMESLIISEQIAKDELENTLDFFIRDNEGSNSFFLFIAKEVEAKECLEKINEDEIDLVSFLKSTQKYKGNANIKTLNDMVKTLLEKGSTLCVNAVTLKDNVELENMAYFRGYNMLGYLSEEESITYNLVLNEVDNTLVSIGSDDDLVVAEIVEPKSKIEIEKNNVNISVNCVAHITQIGKSVALDDIIEKEEIENKLEDDISYKIHSLFEEMRKEEVDIFSIGNVLYRKKNSLFEDKNYLDKLNLIVNVNIDIVNTGGIKKT